MKRNKRVRGLARVMFAAVVVGVPYTAFCQPQSVQSPVELVRQTVQHEIAAGSAGTPVMFTDRKETPHGSQTKLLVQTRGGMAGMVVANNGDPLPPEQQLAEYARLKRLASDPEELKKKQRTEKEDEERVTRIMKALPDAFLYEGQGTEPGTREVGGIGKQLTSLKFRANPAYRPPSRVEQVLTGMQGSILIDPVQHRIARIDGTLDRDVTFGWGILGHLDQGGRFLVEQAEVIKEDWEVTRMDLSFTGKALLFKSLTIKSNETLSDFEAVPSSLTFAQGLGLLKRKQTDLAELQHRQSENKSKP